MNSKSLGLLMMAGVMGLGAMYGTSRLLAKPRGPAVEMQDVLVALRSLRIEEVLKPDMVQVVQKPKESIQPGALTSVKDLEDRWVQIGMLEGEQIVDGKLAAKGSPPGLIARIPTGYRAYAVDVNEQTGVSGFILPDHRVDVVQIQPPTPGNPTAPREADTVLQDVQVLAVGQTLSRPDDRSIQVRTVTLALTPDQVSTLVAAKERGALSLALRGLNDHATVVQKPKPKPVEKPVEVAVKPAEPPPPPAPAPAPPPEPAPAKPPRVVVIYRGSSDKVERVRIGRTNPDDPDAPIEVP